MSAIEILHRISENENLLSADLRYCYVNKDKVPFNGTSLAKPNNPADFLSFCDLDVSLAPDYEGLGISIQASKICAIDVDHCFAKPFDLAAQDDRAKEILGLFSPYCYAEFSFSGTGLRVLFKANKIPNYTDNFYIKNSKTQCEYYYPEGSNRYVTLTARTIAQKPIDFIPDAILISFLNTFMLKPKRLDIERNFEPCKYQDPITHFLRINKDFQDNWFTKAPGSGADESERDFFLVKFIYENISQDPVVIKDIFERSPFFKSKDRKHIYKWENNSNRYFKYLYNVIKGE